MHQWVIEALPEDNYILSTLGGFAAEIDKLLFAVIVDAPKALWKIIPQKQHGEDTYMYVSAHFQKERNNHSLIWRSIVLAECPSDGWIAPQDKPEEEQQVSAMLDFRELIAKINFNSLRSRLP